MNAFKLFVQEEQLLLAQLIMMKVFIDDRALYPHLVQQFINEVRDDSMKGCLYYNLANSLRHYDKLTDSISCYLKARKYEPDYLNRNYWWKELAGVMFVSGHPRFAELFYKKAMSLSGKDEISNLPLLISDCLVVQGKYEEACYTENQYLSNISSETDVNDYLLFKFSITRMMFEQINGPTNNLELFNDGLNYANKGEYEMASYLFLCAWRLDERDNEALSNAFISSLNTGNLQLSLRIMKAIKSLFPEKGYNQIVKSIIGKGKILTKGHNDALDALSDLFDKL
jgi:tetratricopeptide (TPR) repeat protein